MYGGSWDGMGLAIHTIYPTLHLVFPLFPGNCFLSITQYDVSSSNASATQATYAPPQRAREARARTPVLLLPTLPPTHVFPVYELLLAIVLTMRCYQPGCLRSPQPSPPLASSNGAPCPRASHLPACLHVLKPPMSCRAEATQPHRFTRHPLHCPALPLSFSCEVVLLA